MKRDMNTKSAISFEVRVRHDTGTLLPKGMRGEVSVKQPMHS